MRVIAAGTFDPRFSRNRRLDALLQAAGHDVAVCRVDLWGRDRHEVLSRHKLKTFARATIAYPRLMLRFLSVPRGDVVLVQHPGWFDMLVLRPLARVRGMPILFDMFISLSDTVVSDRRMTSPTSLLARFCRLVDRMSLRGADRVLADTPVQADFYARLARIPRTRIGVLWVGAEDGVFKPVDGAAVQPDRVLFYGSFIPLHGLPTIIRAAKTLESDGTIFRVIGTGQERGAVDALIAELQPTNIERVDHVELHQLPGEIASSAVCLGVFGTSEKASRVVPHKVYECTAVGRPVITGDTPGIRSAFDETQLSMVEPGDADALAREISRLLADTETREKLAAAGRARYEEAFATDALTQVLEAELRAALSARSPARGRPAPPPAEPGERAATRSEP
jgi:glycosyltransferase involved in cell wall biosynthesis